MNKAIIRANIIRALELRKELFDLANSCAVVGGGQVAVMLHGACNAIVYAKESFESDIGEDIVQPEISGVREDSAPDFHELENERASIVWGEYYENAECPDCGLPIASDTPDGGACPNCGHVMHASFRPSE